MCSQRSLAYSRNVSAQATNGGVFWGCFGFFAGYNLALIAAQITGRVPNIKEWISSIYTLQVYNHGLHVVAKLLGCNLTLRRIS